jgi:fibronectin-binding autotransporter adhesin
MSHHPPARGASPVRPAYRRPFICAASIALSLGFAPHATLAADGTWTRLDGGISIGLWSDPTAWLNGIIADGDGATANFATPDIIGPSVISLDTSRTIGNLTFGDSDPSTPANWTLDNGGNPANTLTLSGLSPTITANGGSGSTVTIATVLGGTNGLTYSGNSTVLMNGTVGHTYLGDTVLKSRVETTNVANAILTVFGDPSNSVVFDGGYFRIFNTTTSTSAGTLANNLIVNTTGTIEYSGRSSTTGVLTGNGTLNVITHFVRSDNGGNWSGFTGTINVSSGDAGIADFRQTTYNGFLNATLNLGANANLYFVPNQQMNGTTAVDIGALSGVSSAFLRGGPIAGRITTFRIGSKNLDTTFAGSIIEQGTAISNIVKVGTGVLTLSGGTSAYNGPTTINQGTLAVSVITNGGSPSSIGRSSNAATSLVINGGTLRYIGAGDNSDRLFTIGTDNAAIEASGTGPINFTNAGLLSLTNFDSPRSFALAGTNTGANTISGIIGDNGIGVTSVNKSGPGTWVLGGANSYTGPTTITGGVLTAITLADGGLPSSIGQSSNAAGNLVIDGGTLRYAGSAVSTDRSFTVGPAGATLDASGSGGISYVNPAPVTFSAANVPNTLSLAGTSAVDNSFASQIVDNGSGATSLVKTGPGTWLLPVANTYTGSTTINGGLLRISNATGSATGTGPVIVNNTSTFGGAGTAAGAVTINAGAHLAPGVIVGTLTVGSLTLSAGSIVDFEFNTTPANDLVSVATAGGLTINGAGVNLTVASTTNKWTTPGTYNLFQYSGAIGGAGVNSLSVLNPQAGLTYAFGSNGSFIILTIGATATLSDWTSTTSGSWTNALNWSNGIPSAQSDTAKFLGAITAPSTVTLDGNKTVGTVQFGNENSYTIAQGTGGTLILNNGTDSGQILVINGSHTVSAPVSMAGNLSIDVNNAGDTLTASGVIDGPGILTKSGNGTLILGGANAFANGFRIGGGIVQVGNNLSFGTGSVTFTSSAILRAGAASITAANNIVIGNSATATLDSGVNALTVTGLISDSNANGSVTKAGSGTLTLGGNNTYRGKTTIAGGVVIASVMADGGVASSIGQSANAAANLVIDGGSLRYTGLETLTDRLFTIGLNGATIEASGSGALSFTNPTALVLDGANSARTLTLSGSNTGANTLASIISDNGSGATSLVKTGPGAWFLAGANTFTGTTSVTGGTLSLSNSLALQASTLDYNNQGGTLSFDNLGAATLGGLSGGQNLELGNSFGGAIVLTVGANNSSATYSGALTGPGSLIKTGTGVLSLTGQNTYVGPTTIAGNGGALKFFGLDALSPGSAVTVNNPGGLQLGNGATLNSVVTAAVGANEFLDIPDAGATATFGGTFGVGGGANQFRLGITGVGSVLNVTGTTNLPNAASIVFLTRGNLVFSGSSSFFSASGITVGRSAQAIDVLLKDNASFLLGAGASFGGGQANPSIALTIQDAATFDLGSFGLDLNSSTAAVNQTVINLNGGTLTTGAFFKTSQATDQLTSINFNGGTLQAGASNTSFLPAFTALTANVKAGAAKINTNGFDIAIAQPITHDSELVGADGGLIKSGAGSLTLEGQNTYNGPTAVTEGALYITGSISGSAATVATGATLGGSGTIGNASVNGTLAPGTSAGDLTVSGTITFAAGSTLALELNGRLAGTEHDQLTLDITGLLNILGGNLNLVLGFAPFIGDTFTIVENNGGSAITGAFANLPNNGSILASFGGTSYEFRANYQGGDGNDLTLAVVPEPTAAAVLAAGVAALALRRRRST